MEVSVQAHARAILPPVGRLLMSDILKSMLCGSKSILSRFSRRNMGKARKTSVGVDGLRTEFRIVDLLELANLSTTNCSSIRIWKSGLRTFTTTNIVVSFIVLFSRHCFPLRRFSGQNSYLVSRKLFMHYSAWGRVFLLGCIMVFLSW